MIGETNEDGQEHHRGALGEDGKKSLIKKRKTEELVGG